MTVLSGQIADQNVLRCLIVSSHCTMQSLASDFISHQSTTSHTPHSKSIKITRARFVHNLQCKCITKELCANARFVYFYARQAHAHQRGSFASLHGRDWFSLESSKKFASSVIEFAKSHKLLPYLFADAENLNKYSIESYCPVSPSPITLRSVPNDVFPISPCACLRNEFFIQIALSLHSSDSDEMGNLKLNCSTGTERV